MKKRKMNNPLDLVDRLVSIAIGIIAFIGTPFTWFMLRRQRRADADRTEADANHLVASARKLEAETLETTVKTMLLVIDELKEAGLKTSQELKRLSDENASLKVMESEIKELRRENTSLKSRVTELEGQVVERDKKIAALEEHLNKLDSTPAEPSRPRESNRNK